VLDFSPAFSFSGFKGLSFISHEEDPGLIGRRVV
jgi:hypothetical protein